MALALATKEKGTSTSQPYDTGSLSWSAGARGLVAVASAKNNAGGITHSISGGGVTWTQIAQIGYASRRAVALFLSSGTPSTGALTITATPASGTFQESKYIALELSGFDTTTPHDTAQTAIATTGTVLSTPDLGTLDAGDWAFIASGFEGAADGFGVQTGTTLDDSTTGGANVRSLLVGHSTSDDTPGVQWNTSGNGCGIIGVILNAASGGGGEVTGDLDAAIPALTMDAAGAVDITGALAGSLPALTFAGAAAVDVAGTVAGTVPALTLAASGAVAIDGALDAALPTLTLQSAGAVDIVGAMAAELPALTAALAGSTGASTDGALAASLPALVFSGTGAVAIDGTLSRSLPALAFSGAGLVAIDGTLARSLPALTLEATGASTITGALAGALPALTFAGSGAAGAFATALRPPTSTVVPTHGTRSTILAHGTMTVVPQHGTRTEIP